MDAFLIKGLVEKTTFLNLNKLENILQPMGACFPLVVTNATERLQELIDEKVEKMKDEVLTALLNNTDYFIDQSYDYFGTE